MRKYRFKKLDAFASGRSAGNPAGAAHLDSPDAITSEDMLRIAKELKGFVSEVGYVWRIDADTFGLKYYSSEREVEFCGDATIAIMYDLVVNDKELSGRSLIHIVTNKGKLAVENRIKSEDSVFITAPAPAFSQREIGRDIMISAFHVDQREIAGDHRVPVVNAGLETLIVPLRSLNAIVSINPLLGELKGVCSGVDGIT